MLLLKRINCTGLSQMSRLRHSVLKLPRRGLCYDQKPSSAQTIFSSRLERKSIEQRNLAGLIPLVSPSQYFHSKKQQHILTHCVHSSSFDNQNKSSGNLGPEKRTQVGHFEKLKELLRQYGYVSVGVYAGAYIGMLGFTYTLASTGIVPSGDAMQVIEWTGLDVNGLNAFIDIEHLDEYGPQAGKIFTAWLLTKISEPLRIVFTVTVTPTIARRLGYAPKKS